jgi:hypothetical protein
MKAWLNFGIKLKNNFMKLSKKQTEELKNILAHYCLCLGGDDQANRTFEFTSLFDRQKIEETIIKIKSL